MTVTLELNDASAGSTVDVYAASAATTLPRGVPKHMPTMIPRSQLYYWTRAWQEGEAKAIADIEAGRSQVFSDPRELARYLLRPTD